MKRGKIWDEWRNDRSVLVLTFTRVAPFYLRPSFCVSFDRHPFSVIVLCNSVQRFEFRIVSPVCIFISDLITSS